MLLLDRGTLGLVQAHELGELARVDVVVTQLDDHSAALDPADRPALELEPLIYACRRSSGTSTAVTGRNIIQRMRPPTRLLLIGCSLALTIVAIVAAAVDESHEPIAVATGTIYSTESGDPLDVVADIEAGDLCMNAGAFGYGSSISCVDERGAERGSYMVVLPVSDTAPAFVVGVLPEGAVGATVAAGSTERRAETRGRWFMIELPEIDVDDASAVVVDFYT